MTRCLVVDDDPEIRNLVVDYLGRFGLPATGVADGEQMRRALTQESFDVVVLDLMLPGEDGLSLCRWLRGHSSVPVIMLTARGDPMSRVLGLELGADDYLPKPFEPRELVARINAIRRRVTGGAVNQPAAANTLRFKDWTLDRISRQLLSPERVVVPLSGAEFRLLDAFVSHPRRVLSRDQLLDLIRGPNVDVIDRSIDLAVSRLRQKLGDSPRDPQLIRTVRGEGYLFDAVITS